MANVIWGLRAFRRAFYACLLRRGDALFELTDAILTAGAVLSPPSPETCSDPPQGLGQSLRGALQRRDRLRSAPGAAGILRSQGKEHTGLRGGCLAMA